MRKYKLILSIAVALYLGIGAVFFVRTYSADEMPEPTIPTIVGWSYYEGYLSEEMPLYVGLYNPAVNESVNPYVGQKICSVETSFTFPKDIIEVSSISFVQNDSNNYSNTEGVVNFKAELSPCTTIVGIDLFDVTFTTKKIGEGTIHFTKSIVIGGENSVTTLDSGVYQDVPVTVVPMDENHQPLTPIDPLPQTPADTPQPTVKPISKNTGKKSTSTQTVAADPTKKEDSTFKIPTLTKLEFGPDAILNKDRGTSTGAVFTGIADPSTKVNILINSDTILDTVTSGADGTWTYKLSQLLEDGTHEVTVWSEKDNKISKKFTSKFVISSYAKNQIAIGDTYPAMSADQTTSSQFTPPNNISAKIDNVLKNKYFLAYAGVGVLTAIVLIAIIFLRRRHKNDGPNDPNDLASSIQIKNIPETPVVQDSPPEPIVEAPPENNTETDNKNPF